MGEIKTISAKQFKDWAQNGDVNFYATRNDAQNDVNEVSINFDYFGDNGNLYIKDGKVWEQQGDGKEDVALAFVGDGVNFDDVKDVSTSTEDFKSIFDRIKNNEDVTDEEYNTQVDSFSQLAQNYPETYEKLLSSVEDESTREKLNNDVMSKINKKQNVADNLMSNTVYTEDSNVKNEHRDQLLKDSKISKEKYFEKVVAVANVVKENPNSFDGLINIPGNDSLTEQFKSDVADYINGDLKLVEKENSQVSARTTSNTTSGNNRQQLLDDLNISEEKYNAQVQKVAQTIKDNPDMYDDLTNGFVKDEWNQQFKSDVDTYIKNSQKIPEPVNSSTTASVSQSNDVAARHDLSAENYSAQVDNFAEMAVEHPDTYKQLMTQFEDTELRDQIQVDVQRRIDNH